MMLWRSWLLVPDISVWKVTFASNNGLLMNAVMNYLCIVLNENYVEVAKCTVVYF